MKTSALVILASIFLPFAAQAKVQTSKGEISVITSDQPLAVISITGAAAKALYQSMTDVRAEAVEGDESVLQKMGTRLSCTKYVSATGKKSAYRCEATATVEGDFVN